MLSDFGIAKIISYEEDNTLTGTGIGVGTAEYMAPEQWKGKAVPQSDIYSLGVMFYELVTGRKPFTGDTPVDIQIRHITEPVPSPKHYVRDLPAEVERVLSRAMAKKPEDRYASMEIFANELEKIGNEKPKEPTKPKIPASPQSSRPAPIEKTGSKPVDVPKLLKEPSKAKVAVAITVDNQQAAALPASLHLKKYLLPAFAGIVLVILGIVGAPLVRTWGMVSAPVSATTASPVAIAPTNITSPQPFRTATATITPTVTRTHTPAPTATATTDPTPTMGIGSTLISPVDRVVMMYVPAGNFLMGSNLEKDPSADMDELPQHTIYLDSFWIDQTEVTNAMYTICVEAQGCPDLGSAVSKDPTKQKYPAVIAQWDYARKYCQWAGKRLPSEAEWEKAARGTDGRIYPWGNTLAESAGGDSYFGIREVGSWSFDVSPYGVWEMASNIAEWVSDYYSADYYKTSPETNPLGPDAGTQHVMRGGSTVPQTRMLRTTYRHRVQAFEYISSSSCTMYDTDNGGKICVPLHDQKFMKPVEVGVRCVMSAD